MKRLEFERAVADAEHAIALDPKDLEPRIVVCEGLAALGRWREVWAMTERGLEAFPRSHELWTRAARARIRLGDPTGGLVCAEKALALEPQSVEAKALGTEARAALEKR
jgi:hypothetical protein